MAQNTLRACFRVFLLALLLTAGAAQAAPAQAESSGSVVAAIFDWLRAQLSGWTSEDEIYGGWMPNGVAAESPSGVSASDSADEPADDDEIHGVIMPNG